MDHQEQQAFNGLKGKTPNGDAVADGGTAYVAMAAVVFTESPHRNWEEEHAMAALYAEAHNVANESGLWPREMQARISALEQELREERERTAALRAFVGRCTAMRKTIEVVERNEEWSGGQPTYGTPQKLMEIKRLSDEARALLSPKDQQPK